jgi:hypothetical protein
MFALQITDYEDRHDSRLDAKATSYAPNPWTRARCRDGNGTLTHLFFSDEPISIARAKAICAKCSLTDICLESALERLEPWGVWGGELVANGHVVVNKRPRGRPPKIPRPELVVEEVPDEYYVA